MPANTGSGHLVAIEQWRSYLQHAEFTIFMDQRSLMHITDQWLHTPSQMKMYTKLIGLEYKIVYKPGTSNAAADALSRYPSAVFSGECYLLSLNYLVVRGTCRLLL